MAMGPGVCLEYGGMKRYKPGAKRTRSNRSSGNNGSSYTPLLLAIIVVLVGFIVGGFTIQDIQNLL